MSRGKVYNTAEAAAYCGLAEQTLRNLLTAGDGPRREKHGRKNAFFRADLDAWIDERIPDTSPSMRTAA